MPEQLAVQRRERLQAALAAAPFDWLLLGKPENVAYATGYRSVAGDLLRGHRIAALVGPDDCYLVGPCADAAPALDDGIVAGDRYVPYGRFFFETVRDDIAASMADQYESFGDALDEAVRRAAAGRALTVGTDGWLTEAAAVLDAAATVGSQHDASGWVYEVRAVKLPGEVEHLLRAAQLAEAGIDAAMEAAKPGVTERELADIVAMTMAAGGGSPRFVVVTAGERSALADARPTARPCERGNLLRFDVGCIVEGYWSDLGRTGVFGEPTALQAERYQAILAGEQAQLDAVGPGMAASELFDVAVAAVEDAGLVPYRRHHCGHAIGSEVYERPVVAPGWDVPLAEGMVFCVETPFYELGWGGMMVEDTLVVTGDGARLLSSSSRDLRVIDA